MFDVCDGVSFDIYFCLYLAANRQQDLFRVLKAYTLYRPEEGYCQAQAPIAAVLLMHMPAEVLQCFFFTFHNLHTSVSSDAYILF